MFVSEVPSGDKSRDRNAKVSPHLSLRTTVDPKATLTRENKKSCG